MTVSIRYALETAAESIVKSLGLRENTSIQSDSSLFLEEGSIALIVTDNELILGEVRHDIANMHGYQVTNVEVAGTRIFREEYHYDQGFKNPEYDFGSDIKVYSN